MVVPASSHGQYAQDLADVLCRALCLRSFPCQNVERHNKPEIEFGTSKELLLPPITISRPGGGETCLIEPAINSCRVSFRFKGGDALDDSLAATFYRFVCMKAEELPLLRRTAVEGYHVSFLVTWAMLETHGMAKVITFLINFATEFPSFLCSLKCQVSQQNRKLAAACFDGIL
jgi:actin related protein 2/3 complex, subunit 4